MKRLIFRFSSIQRGIHTSLQPIYQLGTNSTYNDSHTNSNDLEDQSPSDAGNVSCQEEATVSLNDINFSTDISELFSFFEPNSSIFSKQENDTKHPTKDMQRNDKGVVNRNKKKKDNSLNDGKVAQQIVMKSSESFPVTDALKDVILDLDIGNTVRLL